LLAVTVTLASTARSADADAVKRGEYLFTAADCVGCHTDAKGGGKRLAGGSSS
jgi:mono/diheme cytochrome c family protein